MRRAAREDARPRRFRRRKAAKRRPGPSRFRRPQLEDRRTRRQILERRVGFHPTLGSYLTGGLVWALAAGAIWVLLGPRGVSLGGSIVALLLGFPLGALVTFLDGRRALPKLEAPQ